MADTKISALPAATTPLTGAELVPIVQSGTTDQVTVSNLTAGRSVAASALAVDANSASVAVRITQTGAGNALVVEDSTSPDGSPFVIDADGRALINATTSYSGFSGLASPLQINNGAGIAQAILRYSADAGGASMQFLKSRSATYGSHTVVSNNDTLANFRFLGSDGTNFIVAAQIAAQVDGTPGTNDMPGRLVFFTTADGASSATERMRIDNAGKVSVTGSFVATTTITSSGATSGVGYSTGAGGAVTQATSRTTGVTLNNVCGAITLVSAAGSATYQSFTVTNSAVTATDTIIVNQKSGADKYIILVTNVAAGSFQITFATTGGTTTEQPVFNFAVIKAVAA